MFIAVCEYYHKGKDGLPDFERRIEKKFHNEKLSMLMDEIASYKENHDIAKYTPCNIVLVVDTKEFNK